MNLTLECEQEDDGRWLAEVPQLPGVLVYGASCVQAMARAQVLALRVLAERLEHDEDKPTDILISIAAGLCDDARPPPFASSGTPCFYR